MSNNWIYYLSGSLGTIILIGIGIIIYRCYNSDDKNSIVNISKVQPLRRIYSISGNLCREYNVMETISDIYEIDEPLLGRGSSGDVMTAIHKGTSRKYAVKIIDVSLNANSTRYEREMEMLREVNHTNIVRLIAVFQSPLTKFFVMELCKGGHLASLLDTLPGHRLDGILARSYILQLTSAISHCHRCGIVHRDVKLQNILIENNGPDAQIKLIDFGNGTRFKGKLPLRNIVGTTYTCAPEVLNQEYDEKCDIWSIGVVSFILHCGQRPFDSDEPLPTVKAAAIHRSILQGTYTFKYELWRDVSVDAKSFIKLCLEKNYKIRKSAAELIDHDWLVNGHADRFSISIGSKQITRSAATLFAQSLSRSSGTGLKQVAMLAIAFEMPVKDVNHFRELFQEIDIDCNGYINREEFHVALHAIEPKLAANVVDSKFDRVDQEGNGHVSFLEFVAALLNVNELTKEQLNYAFYSLDGGNKGYISEEDIKRVLITNNTKPIIYKRIKEMIKYASRNNDNRVTKEDFLWTMVEAAPERSEYSYNQDVLGHLQNSNIKNNGSKKINRRRSSDSGISLTNFKASLEGFNKNKIVVEEILEDVSKNISTKKSFSIGTNQRRNTNSLVVVDRIDDSPQHVPEIESLSNAAPKPSQRRHSWAASKVQSERRGSVLQYLGDSLGLLVERLDNDRIRNSSMSKDSIDSDSEESLDDSESNISISNHSIENETKKRNSLGSVNLMNTFVTFNKMPLDSKRSSPIIGDRKTTDKVQASFRPNSGTIQRADIDEIVNQEDRKGRGSGYRPNSGTIQRADIDEIVNQEDRKGRGSGYRPYSGTIQRADIDEIVNQEDTLGRVKRSFSNNSFDSATTSIPYDTIDIESQ